MEMTFAGYGSKFNGPPDSYGDIVVPGAFAASLRQRMPILLWQHDTTHPVGVYESVREDATGLVVEGRLLETSGGRDTHTLLKGGAINGLSIGFVTRKARYDDTTGIRYLLEVDLLEISVVSFPANDRARVTDVRSTSNEEREMRELLASIKRFGQIAKPDVTIADLVALVKQRNEAIRSLDTRKEPRTMQPTIERAFVDRHEIERRTANRLNREALADAERLLAQLAAHNARVSTLIAQMRHGDTR